MQKLKFNQIAKARKSKKRKKNQIQQNIYLYIKRKRQTVRQIDSRLKQAARAWNMFHVQLTGPKKTNDPNTNDSLSLYTLTLRMRIILHFGAIKNHIMTRNT